MTNEEFISRLAKKKRVTVQDYERALARIKELESHLAVEKDWVNSVNKDNGTLLAKVDELEKLVKELRNTR